MENKSVTGSVRARIPLVDGVFAETENKRIF
jgi:hypothetical protein